PAVGFGTYPMQDQEATTAVSQAIQLGYRMVDTAQQYANEAAVGRAVRSANVPRDELFVVSKLAGAEHGYESTRRACAESVERLGIDYIDLMLIHWPLPRIDKYADSWRAFIELREEGVLRSVGVSNFTEVHI